MAARPIASVFERCTSPWSRLWESPPAIMNILMHDVGGDRRRECRGDISGVDGVDAVVCGHQRTEIIGIEISVVDKRFKSQNAAEPKD